MKLINKLVIVGALASSLAATSVYAIGPGDYARGTSFNTADRLEYIFNQLDLSEDQRTSVVTIMDTVREEHRAQILADREAMRIAQERPTREEILALKETQLEEMRVQLTDQLNTVLSVEDTTALVDYMEFHSSKMRSGFDGQGRRGGRGWGGKNCSSVSSTGTTAAE